MDSVTGTPPPVTATPRPSKTPSFPSREDCWSEDATFTLIEAWGERHVHLSRGNLRQKHWEEVADAVNARHVIAGNPKSRRTDVQCKNRVDTLKKKYKIEKTRVSESNGSHTSSWPFFARLDSLIGSTFPKPSPPPPHRNLPALPWNVPVAPRSATLKRPAPSAVAGDEYWLRRNFNAFAAVAEAAAAAEAEEEEEESEEEEEGFRSRSSRRREREREVGYRELAMAIERFGEIYERVEETKQRQIVELEKQRMQFAKDLEFHRMQLFMETQLQIQKMKRAKRSSDPDSYF